MAIAAFRAENAEVDMVCAVNNLAFNDNSTFRDRNIEVRITWGAVNTPGNNRFIFHKRNLKRWKQELQESYELANLSVGWGLYRIIILTDSRENGKIYSFNGFSTI
jgi:hypothetical protein